MHKTAQVRSTLWSSDVKKLHPAVARSKFANQNAQNSPGSEHFMKFRCRKIARRCGEKHMCKSKCAKHRRFGALFAVPMSKNCRPLWREVKTAVAQSTCISQNVQNTTFSDHFRKLRRRKVARRYGAKHICKWKCTKRHILGPLFDVPMSKNCLLLWREARFQVKMCKAFAFPHTFGPSDVENVSDQRDR